MAAKKKADAPAPAGHNSVAASELRAFIERIERLEDEKATLAGDIREVFAEAKAGGFDTKVMRQIVKLRKMDPDDREEQEEILKLYKAALGMNSGEEAEEE